MNPNSYGTLTPSSKPHPTQAGTLPGSDQQGSGLPSLCQALADRLEFAAVVDVDNEVRDALATLAEWMRSGNFDRLTVASWLVGVHRDVQPW
jgi:hypothetical protein